MLLSMDHIGTEDCETMKDKILTLSDNISASKGNQGLNENTIF